MIEARPSSLAALAARLAAKAAQIAAAKAHEAALARRDPPARWRRADLLWPLFAGRDERFR